MPDDTNKNDMVGQTIPGWITAALAGAISALMLVDFLNDPNKWELSAGVLTALAFLILVVMAGFFDKMSVGKILTLERRAKTEQKQREQAEDRADKLMSQMINLNATIQNQSTSNAASHTHNYYGLQPSPASAAESLRDEEEKQEELDRQRETESSSSPSRDRMKATKSPPPAMRLDFRRIEEITLGKVADRFDVKKEQLAREIKLSKPDAQYEITSRPYIFDAVLQKDGVEYFIEVRAVRPSRGLIVRTRHFIDQFSHYLYLVQDYSRSRRVKAKFLVVLAILPTDNDDDRSVEREVALLEKHFAPAISNGLLEVIKIDISEDEIEQPKD